MIRMKSVFPGLLRLLRSYIFIVKIDAQNVYAVPLDCPQKGLSQSFNPIAKRHYHRCETYMSLDCPHKRLSQSFTPLQEALSSSSSSKQQLPTRYVVPWIALPRIVLRQMWKLLPHHEIDANWIHDIKKKVPNAAFFFVTTCANFSPWHPFN